MTTADIKRLEGNSVLVRSETDTHNPPVGVRGSIHVLDTDDAHGEPRLEVVIEYPDLFNQSAHRQVIVLEKDAIDLLLASGSQGALEITVPIRLG